VIVAVRGARRAPLSSTADDNHMTESPYFIRRDVFLCRWDLHWIALDVARDKYLCIPKSVFESVAPWLRGCHELTNTIEDNPMQMSPEIEGFASEMMKHGILTMDPTCANYNAVMKVPKATRAVGSPLVQSRAGWLGRFAPSFMVAAYTADFALRYRDFMNVVKAARIAKSRVAYTAHLHSDSRQLGELVSQFNRLRPIYPRNYLCLFDSLALIRFLARHHMHSDWVFGVSADPFYAHCWVQQGDLLLNDIPERISRYRPIMVI
jgi:hypothetical protein